MRKYRDTQKPKSRKSTSYLDENKYENDVQRPINGSILLDAWRQIDETAVGDHCNGTHDLKGHLVTDKKIINLLQIKHSDQRIILQSMY